MKAKMNLWARRALAFVLSFVMAIGGVPAQAFAAESGPNTQFYYKFAVNGVEQYDGFSTSLPTDPTQDWGYSSEGFIEYLLEMYDGEDREAQVSALGEKEGSSNILFYKNGRQGTFFTVTDEDAIAEDEASVQVTYRYGGGTARIVTVTVSLTRVLIINSTTATAEDVVYSGEPAKAPEVTLTYGDDETEILDTNYRVGVASAAVNVGTYWASITPKPLDEQTYQDGIGKLVLDYQWVDYDYREDIPFSVQYKVVPATISGSFDQLEFEENGEGQAPTFTPTGIVDGEDEDDILQYDYASDKADYTDWSADKRSEAGKYAIRVSLKDTDAAKNYVLDPWSVPELEDEDIPEDATTIEVKFEIKPYERELTVDIEGWTYDEYDAEANAPVAQLDGEDLTDDEAALVTYEYKGADEDDDAYTTTVPTKAGDYTVRATFTPFDGATTLTATKDFTVSKRTVKATITVDPDAWYVDEEAPTPTVDAVYNTPTKDTKAFYRKSGDSDWIDWAQNPPTEVGTYEAVAICRKADGTSEYTNVIVESDDPVAFEIKEREQLSVTLDDWVYGEDPKDAETKYGDEVVTADKLEYKAKDAGDDAYDETVPTDAGEYTVRATYYPLGKADDGSYIGDAYTATDDFKITPYEYVVRAVDDEVTYGTTPDLHWSDDEDPLPEGVLPTATLEDAYDEQSGKVGTYAILFKDAEFEKDEEGNYLPATVTYGNYSITYVPGTLTVLPLAEVTVTVKDERIVYGNELPEFQVSQEPEEPVVEATAVVEDAYEESNHDVGTYAIIYEGVELDKNDDGEYIATTIDEEGVLVTYVPGTLTVSPKVINVKPDDQTKVYGEEDPELTYQLFDAETGEETELPEGDELELKIYRDKGEEADEYAIFFLDQDETYAQAGHEGGNPNNCIIFNFQTGTFTITRRKVTVTPVPSGKKVGEDDPELSAEVEGATKGETVTYTLEREPGEEPGEYQITAKGEAIQGSYEVEYKTGTFVITEDEKTEIIVADDLTKVYGDDDPEFTTTPESTKFTLIREAGEDVGEYAITFADEGEVIDDYGTVKYVDTEEGITYYLVPGTLTITPKKVTIEGITAQSKTYDRTRDVTLDTSEAQVIEPAEFEGVKDELTVEAKGVFEDKDAGKGKTVYITDITLEGEKADNYEIDWENTELTTTADIEQKKVTVTPKDAKKEYGEDDPDYEAEVEGLIYGDIVFYYITRTQTEDAGEYTLKAQGMKDQGNYEVSFGKATLTITPKKVTVDGIKGSDKTYDGTVAAKLDCSEAVVHDPAFKDQLKVVATGEFEDKNVAWEGENVADKTVKITEIKLEGEKAGNYEVVAEESQTETSAKIFPAELKVSGITAKDKTYDGTTEATLVLKDATFETLYGEDVVTVESATGTFEDKNVAKDADGNVIAKDVSITEIVLGGADGGNYVVVPADGEQATTTAKIEPLPVVVDNIEVAYHDHNGTQERGKEYDGTKDCELDTENATIETVLEIDEGKVSVKSATGEYKDAGVGTNKLVTILSVELEGDEAINYVATPKGDPHEPASIWGKKVTITVDEGQSKIYGQDDPDEFTATISPALPEGDSVDYELTRVEGEDAGQYTISFVNPQKQQGNYECEYVEGLFTIESREVTLTADDSSKIYGEADPELTATVSSDEFDPALVEGDELEYEIVREPGEEYGEYAIYFKGTDPQPEHLVSEYQGGENGKNYHVTYVDGTFNIDSREITVTADDKVKDYGDADPEWTVTYTLDSEGTDPAVVDGDEIEFTINRTKNVYEGDGGCSYTIPIKGKASQAGHEGGNANNYKVNFVDGTLDVNRLKVQVIARDTTKTYGDEDPEFTAKVKGCTKGDTVSYEIERKDGAEDVGEYEGELVPVGKAVQGSYEVEFVPGKLTIEPREVTVTPNDASKTYGQADPKFDATVEGLVGDDTIEYAVNTREPGEDVGTYDIYATGEAEQGNYKVKFATGTLTIKGKKVTVTAKDASKTYGNKDPKFKAKVKGTLNGDTVEYKLIRQTGEDAGTYAIMPTGDSVQGNYIVTFKGGTFTINRRQVTVKADDLTKYYSFKDPKLTATVTGVDKGETVTYKLKREKGEDVGTYKITASGKALQGNYEVTFKPGKLTIQDVPKLLPEYSAHMMSFGWSPATYDGDFAGTTGQKRRMEALTLKVVNAPYKGGITYRANVQGKGWMAWKKDGALAGTWGKSLQSEAFQIKLYGEMAKHFDVYYRVHVKGYGWMAWAKNGQTAGTIGQDRRCEAIQVIVLRKGSKAPKPNYKGVAQMYNKASE